MFFAQLSCLFPSIQSIGTYKKILSDNQKQANLFNKMQCKTASGVSKFIYIMKAMQMFFYTYNPDTSK